MNAGRFAAGAIVILAVLAGGAIWWLQEYGYYRAVDFGPGAAELRLMPIVGEAPEAVPADNARGIDSDSSPLRFRACFTLPLSQAMLSETYRIYDAPTPLVGPSSFDCYDAGAIAKALETGEALAFYGEPRPEYGVDRVVAVYPDGRAFAWHQMNACGTAHYDRRDLPEGCPPPPAEDRN